MVGIDMKSLEQALGIFVVVGVEPVMGVSVAPEKAFEAEDIGVVGSTDDHRPTHTRFEESHTAQDERAHDSLTQLGLLYQKASQFVRSDDQGFHLASRDSVDQGGAPGDLSQLTHERTRTVNHDRSRRGVLIAWDDSDLALQDDERSWAHLACPGQEFFRSVGPRLPEAAQPVYLVGFQGREHLLPPGLDDCTLALSHGLPRAGEASQARTDSTVDCLAFGSAPARCAGLSAVGCDWRAASRRKISSGKSDGLASFPPAPATPFGVAMHSFGASAMLLGALPE